MSTPSYSPPRLSATNSLILLNVVVFMAGLVAQQNALFAIPVPDGSPTSIFEIVASYSWFNCMMQGEIWRLFTYQFVHASLGHLAFNMLALYFFGSLVENFFGSRRFLAYYFVCGFAGALFSSLLSGLHIFSTIPDSPQLQLLINYVLSSVGYLGEVEVWQLIPLVGASASIYGVMVAAAFLFPHAMVSLIFPPVTLSLRTLAIVVIAIATLTVVFSGNNAGGEAGHLGGIIMGAIIMSILKYRYLRGMRR